MAANKIHIRQPKLTHLKVVLELLREHGCKKCNSPSYTNLSRDYAREDKTQPLTKNLIDLPKSLGFFQHTSLESIKGPQSR